MLSLAVIVALYLICYGLLHPGYAINDDLKMISMVAGYPGLSPTPFLVFSNVLWGFILMPLYALRVALNWEMILFSTINLISLWTLLYILFSAPSDRTSRVLGTALLLANGLYFSLNLTFSSTAALASFAGFTAILAGTSRGTVHHRALAVGGVALIVCGSLIRIQMLLLVLPPILTAAAFLYRAFVPRQLVVAIGCAALLVFTGYAFDRLYVRAHPDWNTYYFYNKIAQMVQDSHRLENMHLEIRRIGWSGNDQELFARYFFPDAGVYSIDRLQFLVGRVSGIGQNPLYSAQAFLDRVATLQALPFLLACAAIWLWEFSPGRPSYARVAIPLVIGASLAENLALVWIYKNPNYVLFSLLATASILVILLPGWPSIGNAGTGQPRMTTRRRVAVAFGAGLLAILAVVGSVAQAAITSSENARKQTEYAMVLSDLGSLQREGRIKPNAVIVSPAHGIPWDWSNPLLLDLPGIPYLDTGWSTFSPPYDEALKKFDLDPLPESLYKNDHAYLITESIFKGFLARYYQEHDSITVRFETLYVLPNPYHYEGYEDVELYRVIAAP